MVKTFLKQKQEIDADGDEQMQDSEKPNWNAPDDQEQGTTESNKEWFMSNYYDIEIRLRDDLRQKDIHAVDTTSIVPKSDPIPLKDVKPDF